MEGFKRQEVSSDLKPKQRPEVKWTKSFSTNFLADFDFIA